MPSKPNILILGPSGSGKSNSLANLPKDCTALIDIERKGFPFLGVNEFAQHHEPETVIEANDAITKAYNDPKVKLIVVDSLFKYSELASFYAKGELKKTGYDVFNWHNAQIDQLFQKLKATKKCFIITDIDEIVMIDKEDGTRLPRQRAAIQYKWWEGKIEKEFLITLTTKVTMNAGKPTFLFNHRADGIGPAKCPPYISLPDSCPNDVNLIVKELQRHNLL